MKLIFVLLLGSSLVFVSVLVVEVWIVLVFGCIFIVIDWLGWIKLIDVWVFCLLVCVLYGRWIVINW